MNYTENYHLPQWEETDRIMRTDFNQMCANAQNTSSGEGSGQGIIMAGGSVTAKMLTLTENGFRYEVTNAWLPFPKVNESGQPYCYIAFR